MHPLRNIPSHTQPRHIDFALRPPLDQQFKIQRAGGVDIKAMFERVIERIDRQVLAAPRIGSIEKGAMPMIRHSRLDSEPRDFFLSARNQIDRE
jgi:hypothetical protein